MADITADIHRLCDDRLASGVIVHVEWVARAILDEHPEIAGSDAPLYRDWSHKELCRLVKSTIGKYQADDTTPEQLVLPGFKHLARAYPIDRDGERVLVPVDLCTDAELLDRAGELKKQAVGCQLHARELIEYVRARREAAA